MTEFNIEVGEQEIQTVDLIFERHSYSEYAMFYLKGDSSVELDFIYVGMEENKKKYEKRWNKFVKELTPTEAKYGVVNFTYLSPEDGIERCKRMFVMWAPQNIPTREKLKISMYSQTVQRKLSRGAGFQIYIQANDLDDLKYDVIMSKIKSSCYCV